VMSKVVDGAAGEVERVADGGAGQPLRSCRHHVLVGTGAWISIAVMQSAQTTASEHGLRRLRYAYLL